MRQRFLHRIWTTLVWSLPVVLPLLTATLSLVVAGAETSELGDITWALLAIPVLGVVGAWARAKQGSGWGNALGAALIGVIPGYFIWYQALEATCHGAYECPF
jgi:hypothetical protein